MNNIVETVLCQFFLNSMQFAISCFKNFLCGIFTQNVVTKWVFLKNSFRIFKFLILFCNSLHVLLVLVKFLVRDAVDSKIKRALKLPIRPNATPMELGWSPISATSSRFPEASAERWSSYEPIFLWVLLLVLLEAWVVWRTFSRFPLSLTIFTTHSFSTDWYVTKALESVCQNSKPAFCAERKWT